MDNHHQMPRPHVTDMVTDGYVLPDQWVLFVHLFHTLRLMNKLPTKPQYPGDEVASWNYDHMLEEMNELREAIGKRDLVEMIDAIGDLIYVALGLALRSGVNMTAIFTEIHISNMEKIHNPDPELVRYGKRVIKPAGWQKPRIEQLLLEMGGTP